MIMQYISLYIHFLCYINDLRHIRQYRCETIIHKCNAILKYEYVYDSKSKRKSKKTLFKVGQCKQTTLALTWSEC